MARRPSGLPRAMVTQAAITIICAIGVAMSSTKASLLWTVALKHRKIKIRIIRREGERETETERERERKRERQRQRDREDRERQREGERTFSVEKLFLQVVEPTLRPNSVAPWHWNV